MVNAQYPPGDRAGFSMHCLHSLLAGTGSDSSFGSSCFGQHCLLGCSPACSVHVGLCGQAWLTAPRDRSSRSVPIPHSWHLTALIILSKGDSFYCRARDTGSKGEERSALHWCFQNYWLTVTMAKILHRTKPNTMGERLKGRREDCCPKGCLRQGSLIIS